MKIEPLFAALALSACFLLTGCKLDHKELESTITKKFKEKDLALKDVSCPERPFKKGDTFECTGKTDDDDKVTINVTQKDAAGNVSFEIQGAVIDPEKLGDSIEEKVGTGADVKCPSKVIVLNEGEKIKCKVVIKGQEHSLEIKAKDDEGNVSWKILD